MSNAKVVPRPPSVAGAAARTKSWKSVFIVVAMAAAGAVVGFLGARHGIDLLLPMPGSRWLKLLVVLWVIPAWLLAVGWHEGGHVVGGWCGGGRQLLWIVGPFKVQRTPTGWRAGWNKSVNLSGGLAACVPAGLVALEQHSLSSVVNPFAREQLTSLLAKAGVQGAASGP